MNFRKILDWRKLLIYSHRWMGIVGGLLFVSWFFSGIMMMYWGMPSFRDNERLSHVASLDLSKARVEPADVVSKMDIKPASFKIEMYYDGRPAYRFADNLTVYADTGEKVAKPNADQAIELVRHFEPQHASTVKYDTLLSNSDQWTLQEGPYSQMPLHRINVGDAADTVYYVSEKTGETVQKTDRPSRYLGFLSAVLHYVYIPQLKRQRGLWDGFIVWGSLVGSIMCLTGLIAGIWRYSMTAKFRMRGSSGPSHSPYSGWLKWHHYAGLIFGLISFTFIFSGGASLNPYGWYSSTTPTGHQRHAATGGAFKLESVSLDKLRGGVSVISKTFPAKSVEVFQFRGETYLGADKPVDYDPNDPRRPSSDHVMASLAHPEYGTFRKFDDAIMMDVAKEAMPDTAIAETTWLQKYDNYYRSKDNSRALPVLRVRYADSAATWLYLDPTHGTIAQKQDKMTRARRWFYNGLHSFDIPYIYEHRILRDTLMIATCLGGLALSVTTLLPMFRRLKRHVLRLSPR
jgi:hypothetical protein